MIDIEKLKPQLDENDITFFLGEMYYTVSGAMKMIGCGRNKITDYIADGTLEVLKLPAGDAFSPDSIRNWGIMHTINGDGKMNKKKDKN